MNGTEGEDEQGFMRTCIPKLHFRGYAVDFCWMFKNIDRKGRVTRSNAEEHVQVSDEVNRISEYLLGIDEETLE